MQGKIGSCKLLVNVVPFSLVVGRASGGGSAVFDLLAEWRCGLGGTGAGARRDYGGSEKL